MASAGPYANNMHLAQQITSLLNFHGSDALPDAQPTVSKALNSDITF